MWALGDKIASSIVAQTAGIPTLPWSGSGVSQFVYLLVYDQLGKIEKNICLCAKYVIRLSFSGLTVEWTESNQKKKTINVPADVFELGCIQDVEDGLKVSMSFQ